MVIYATPSSSGAETLWARSYNAHGKPSGSSVRLGALGLVAQTQIATFDPKRHGLLVTLGSKICVVTGSRSRLFITVPKPWQVLSIHWIQGALYAVVERPGQSHGSIWTLQSHKWQVVDSELASGIVTLMAGPLGHPTAWVVDPHHADTVVLDASRQWRYPAFRGGSPGGTVAFQKTAEVVPYAEGAKGFGQWVGYPNRLAIHKKIFPSARQAVIAVASGDRLWGMGALGMIPYRGLHPLFTHIHRWPIVMQTTLVRVGSGKPWLVVLDGPSEGLWFNTRTGQFGPRFTIILPFGDIARAVVVTDGA